MALQKKLIAGGAKIKADGLMGPNTRAAMKAAGMSTSTPCLLTTYDAVDDQHCFDLCGIQINK